MITIRVARATVWTSEQQGEIIFLWQFVIVRTLIYYGEALKVLRWCKWVGAFGNKLQTLHDFRNSYTVQWLHNDRCSFCVWVELYLQRKRELRRELRCELRWCTLVAGPFSSFNCSTVTLSPCNFVTPLHHFPIPSSRPFLTSLSRHLVPSSLP